MKVLVFGASGMVGQGVLRECLLDPDVTEVRVVGRAASGQHDPKLRESVLADVSDLGPIESEIAGYDACFYCVGVSSAGMSEADYRRVTLDLSLRVARALSERAPSSAFVFVSGASSDATGKSRMMWARVKGEAENAIAALPFRATYLFRPGFIQPLHGIRSRTPVYRVLYTLLGPLTPLLKTLLPRRVTTTEEVGRAMLRVVRERAPSGVYEQDAITRLGRGE